MNDSSTTARFEDPDYIDRLATALEQRDAGEAPDLRRLCADRPELIQKIEAALRDADSLPRLHGAAEGIDPMLGRTVGGRYTLLDRVGSGGMGVVYRARDDELRRDVALKMLHPEFGATAELEARLAREAEVLASVRHPAIVTAFDRGRGDLGSAYLVMPLLEGMTGSELLEAAPARRADDASVAGTDWLAEALESDAQFESNYVRQVATWIARIARGLGAVHERGVVHRDVKPSNVFIQRDGNPVLLDFGLVTFGPDTTLAERTAALGTPAYMAPEQLDPRAAPTPAVDVYGLAATLYQFLTFRRPFGGTPSQVLAALMRKDPVPADRLRPGLPRDLLAILDKAMSKDPRRRYPSAAGFAEDLEAWLDYRPVSARPVSAPVRACRRAWRSPTVKTLAAVAAVAVVVGAAELAIDARERSRQARRVELVRRLPSFTLFAPSTLQRVADPERDAAVGALLAELADLEAEPSPARILYAGYLRHRDRHDDAARQMRAVADRYGTPTVAALARLYAERRHGPALPVDDLPEPRGDADRFALAYHLLWPGATDLQLKRSAALIQACAGGQDIIEEFSTWHRFVEASTVDDAARRSDMLFDAFQDMVRVEEARGYRTAMSARNASMLLSGLHRPSDALRAAADGVDLTDSDFSLWQHLGWAQLHVGEGRWDDVIHSVERLLELQPDSYSGHELMLQVLLDKAEFDRAASWIEKVPFAAAERGRLQRATWEARVLIEHAYFAWAEDPDRARALARRAYETVSATLGPDAGPTLELLHAAAIRDPVGHYANVVNVTDPMDDRQLRAVALLMPQSLDREQTHALNELLLRWTRRRSPRQKR